ncbi:class I SAM-dependent methyltransferase [Stagnihabitans tardus]|uniref:Methyltransferase type 12 n=1 Tax=Stagnihabitans tardus TaxID=2699202 RepID=A0AAE4YAQ7_9RHOB|nr:methyltransferase type 12 [Stagnihabitans tardus]NBZ87848.1 methyltransferase type 12 [Stagnihabitans tardus]
MSETLLFFRQLVSKPIEISAIAPSSRFLAKAMARDLGPRTGRVVEFGPGTGRLTKGILNAGVAPEDLALYEMNPDFVTHLRAKFPGVSVHHAPAQTSVANERDVGAVISGLPLLSMPEALRREIVAAAFKILRPDGIYVQFTYGPRPALTDSDIEALNLTWTQTGYVALNLPPARVHTFRRK